MSTNWLGVQIDDLVPLRGDASFRVNLDYDLTETANLPMLIPCLR